MCSCQVPTNLDRISYVSMSIGSLLYRDTRWSDAAGIEYKQRAPRVIRPKKRGYLRPRPGKIDLLHVEP
jgi:hypothetical protein